MITVGSLFSGIGGLDLGLERAGMKVAWQVEIDEFCRKVLAKHWPGVPQFADVHDCGAHNLEPVDLICGGFPCQPVSHAGKQRGDEDERWLWPEFARIVCDLRPRWVLVENVLGLLSADDGRIFGTILRDLAACGYDVEWDCIPAAAVGAPHLRYRTFFVAHTGRTYGDGWPGNESGHGFGYGQVFGDGTQAADHPKRRGAPKVANSQEQPEQAGERGRRSRNGGGAGDVPYADGQGLAERAFLGEDARQELQAAQRAGCKGEGMWATEPDVGRVAYGIPDRVDRLRALGNAVVPQVAEWIGRRIVEAAAAVRGPGAWKEERCLIMQRPDII